MRPLSPQARSASTIGVLCLLLVAGLAWGWWAMTRPLPRSASAEPCTSTPVRAGDKVRTDDVLVSVLNAGRREGLAGRTMQLFVDQGFGEGTRANAPDGTKVAFAQVWADDPDGPAARLVASWLGPRVVVRREPVTAPGVVVVVGNRFDSLRSGRRAVTAEQNATVCMPPEDVLPTQDPDDLS